MTIRRTTFQGAGQQLAPPPAGHEAVSAWLTELAFDWSPLTRSARRQPFREGVPLFHEGDPAATVFILETGRVRLATFNIEGKERHLMIVGPTGMVGDCGLRASPRYVVSAVGASDGVALALPSAMVLEALGADPRLMHQHMQLAGQRFRVMLQQLDLQQGPHSGLRRVCHHLLGLLGSYGQPHAEGQLISIVFTQLEMGNICGLSRVSVSQIFTRLERDGIIGRAGRRVVVRDSHRLVNLARGEGV